MLKAAKFAKMAHTGQSRANGTPYYKHPMAVAGLLWTGAHRNPHLLAAAYLHDVLEDTEHTPATLRKAGFSTITIELVQSVTKRASDKAQPREYFERVKAAGKLAMALKMADRQHNNSELHLLPADKSKMREKAHEKTRLMWSVFYGLELK